VSNVQLRLAFHLVLGTAAGSAGVAAQEPTQEPEPCNLVELAELEPPWRLVRAEGFTLCVPGDWHPTSKRSAKGIDARTWRVHGGEITWGTAGVERAKVPFVVSAASRRRMQPLPPPATTESSKEEIAGHVAELSLTSAGGSYMTRVVWQGMPVTISGTAFTPALATLQHAIYRTVRFPAQ
jgi:hypothetical protein